ncbi:Heat shock protein GrpE [Moraxella catarrhalis]|nr:Heat shock protein GrpE [Moraxella catarrhalis]
MSCHFKLHDRTGRLERAYNAKCRTNTLHDRTGRLEKFGVFYLILSNFTTAQVA